MKKWVGGGEGNNVGGSPDVAATQLQGEVQGS